MNSASSQSHPPSSTCVRNQAKELEVIHGRLRNKIVAKIARNSIGTVKGLSDDGKGVSVTIKVAVEDKQKEVTAYFSADILEPQKDPEPDDKKKERPVAKGAKKIDFLSEDGGGTLEVGHVGSALQCTCVTNHARALCIIALCQSVLHCGSSLYDNMLP